MKWTRYVVTIFPHCTVFRADTSDVCRRQGEYHHPLSLPYPD